LPLRIKERDGIAVNGGNGLGGGVCSGHATPA